MKFLKSLILVIAMATFVGCSSDEAASDIAVADLATAVDTAISADSLVAVEQNYLTNSMQIDVENFSEFAVKVNSTGVNIDEYGIFKVKDDIDVEEARKGIVAYLQVREDTWMGYLPEELPKLEAASVKVEGQYIMYAILSDEQSELAYDAFEAEFAND